ncbi:MAG: AroB-related putative sugar phosphate phospholyase (cyclizing) [Bacteroidales bacterium]
MQINVKSNIKDYSIDFYDNFDFLSDFSSIKEKFFIVDKNVWEYYSETLLKYISEEQLYILPISEDRKNLDTVQTLYKILAQKAAKKNITLISIGGGITQDITGFLASTLYRGINWIYIPSTLLSQADSCLGSKTSLNVESYKNIIGTFYPPTKIYLCCNFIQTLPTYDFYSGMGEVVKLFLMGGIDKTEELKGIMKEGLDKMNAESIKKIVFSCLQIKHSYIADDEFDTGKRNLLNYGHCFGHALETSSHYEIPHGQAVLIGIIFANSIAQKRGLLSIENHNNILQELIVNNLNASIEESFFDIEILYAAMKMDKKRVGNELPLIILKDNFELEKITDLSYDDLHQGIFSLIALLKSYKKITN